MSIKTVTTDWGEMAYVDSDRSRLPLLFLHGTGCDLWDWMSVVEGLTPHLRYIALDFRGHGQSSVPLKPFTVADLADDVLFLIDYLQVQEMLLVGHSLGGMVAMEVAQHSSRVAGLVLIEGWTSLSAANEAFETGRFYGSLSETEIAHIQCKAEGTRHRFKPEVWNIFWASVKRFDGYSYLQDAGIPICEVFGSMGRNDSSEKKLRVPPNPRIEWRWLHNAGHYLAQECPDEVAEVCVHHLEDLIKDCRWNISCDFV